MSYFCGGRGRGAGRGPEGVGSLPPPASSASTSQQQRRHARHGPAVEQKDVSRRGAPRPPERFSAWRARLIPAPAPSRAYAGGREARSGHLARDGARHPIRAGLSDHGPLLGDHRRDPAGALAARSLQEHRNRLHAVAAARAHHGSAAGAHARREGGRHEEGMEKVARRERQSVSRAAQRAAQSAGQRFRHDRS